MDISFGSLFAGIGGLDLGLERAGMTCKWQVENNLFCQKVLAKHWPEVRRYEDVRSVGKHNLEPVDLICGGFPCPVVSQAAHGRNTGEWLWPEFARVIHEMSPRWVLIENVSSGGAWKRWLPIVRRDLWRLGYSSLPLRLRASQFGAPFRGERIYLVATSDGNGKSISTFHEKTSELQELTGFSWTDWGDAPPGALGVAHGIPNRVDRLRSLGKAVVPQKAEWIGRIIAVPAGRRESRCLLVEARERLEFSPHRE